MISVAGGIVSDTQGALQLRSLRAALFKEACQMKALFLPREETRVDDAEVKAGKKVGLLVSLLWRIGLRQKSFIPTRRPRK